MNIRKVTLLLFLLLAVLIIFVGCSGNGTDEDLSNEGENTSHANVNSEDGQKLESLTYFVDMNGNAAPVMTDYNGIAAYQELEKMTGVHVEFEHPPAGEEGTQQFNLMMASGDYPDVIETLWANIPGGPESYLKGGQIIALNDYLEEYAPNFSKLLEENPEWKKQISTDDGSIYGFPFLRGEMTGNEALTFFGPALRKDWLDNVGLDVPETIDEWETVLRAFKTEDPNGNGEADEIPFLPNVTSNMFIGAWGITPGLYQVDNEVRYGPIQPEFKEYLTLMNQWYEEGLLDQNYVTSDADLTDAKVTQHELGALMLYNGGGMGKYMGLMEDDPDFQLVGAPWPTLNKGETPIVGSRDSNYNGVAAAISSTNENIEETISWLDQGYSDEGYMLFNWGIEGESYEMVDGKPVYTELIKDNPDGLPMVQALAQYTRVSWSGPFIQDNDYHWEYYQFDEQIEALDAWSAEENEILLPITSPTPEESQELSTILADLNTYKDSMVDLFITGQEPLSKFDEFVETLQSMNIERVIEIHQNALDRYNQR